MPDFDETAAAVTREFPDLVIEVSGPWHGPSGGDPTWISNFKARDDFLSFVHPGSKGVTPSEALAVGLEFLRSRPGKPA